MFSKREISKPTRVSVRASNNTGQNEKLSIQYFSQLLDIETVCDFAHKNLKKECEDSTEMVKDLRDDEWKYSFPFPINTKY